MVNSKLVSLRISEKTLQAIDIIANAQEYRSRSSVINAILTNACQCSGQDDLFRLVDTKFAYEKGFVLTFTQSRDKIKYRAGIKE